MTRRLSWGRWRVTRSTVPAVPEVLPAQSLLKCLGLSRQHSTHAVPWGPGGTQVAAWWPWCCPVPGEEAASPASPRREEGARGRRLQFLELDRGQSAATNTLNCGKGFMKEIYCPRVVTSPVLCFLQKLTALQHGTSYRRRSAAPAQPRPRAQSTLLGLPGAPGATLGGLPARC